MCTPSCFWELGPLNVPECVLPSDLGFDVGSSIKRMHVEADLFRALVFQCHVEHRSLPFRGADHTKN